MAFIIKPLVTEKMTKITDKSSVEKTYKVKGETRTKKAEAKYGFIVKPEANKLEIKKEVESLYNVTVIDVNTVRYAGKRSSRYTKAGLIKGQKNAFKKAIVTLKEGDRYTGSKTQGYWHVRGYYCIRAREVSRLR